MGFWCGANADCLREMHSQRAIQPLPIPSRPLRVPRSTKRDVPTRPASRGVNLPGANTVCAAACGRPNSVEDENGIDRAGLQQAAGGKVFTGGREKRGVRGFEGRLRCLDCTPTSLPLFHVML